MEKFFYYLVDKFYKAILLSPEFLYCKALRYDQQKCRNSIRRFCKLLFVKALGIKATYMFILNYKNGGRDNHEIQKYFLKPKLLYIQITASQDQNAPLVQTIIVSQKLDSECRAQ